MQVDPCWQCAEEEEDGPLRLCGLMCVRHSVCGVWCVTKEFIVAIWDLKWTAPPARRTHISLGGTISVNLTSVGRGGHDMVHNTQVLRAVCAVKSILSWLRAPDFSLPVALWDAWGQYKTMQFRERERARTERKHEFRWIFRTARSSLEEKKKKVLY